MSDDLWDGSWAEHDLGRRQAALDLADAHLETVMPFLLAARSPQEYAHRSALAQGSIAAIAHACDLDPEDLMATARRRYELCREALAEGQDPAEEVAGLASNGSGYGSGPAKPDEHDEGPDFSGSYAEVPQGAPGGPSPDVTRPRPPYAGPVTQATGSLRRQADAMPESAMMPAFTPPETGTGPGSLETGVPSPEMGGMAPTLPAGSGEGPLPPRQASADPVLREVIRVEAMISRSNPGLPEPECGRIARAVVGRYLTAATDLSSQVISDTPAGPGPAAPQGGDHGGGAASHMLEGQGLRSLLPGMGGGGAAAGAGELAEAAPLLAL